MRIVCISDTHSLHGGMSHEIPSGDVLIHAGDVSNMGTQRDVEEFVYWYMNLKGFDTKIFIAGNHDWAFENHRYPHHSGEYEWYYNLMYEENLSQSDVVYLEDSGFTIESPEFKRPVKFWGSPWQPEFYNWAFNLPRLGDDLKRYWDMIPTDTDVLITHGPPNGFGDLVNNWRQPNMNVGCELLRNRIEEINPLVSVFGHIHEGYGVELGNKTLFVNASICNPGYSPINKPIIIDLQEVYGEIIATHVEI